MLSVKEGRWDYFLRCSVRRSSKDKTIEWKPNIWQKHLHWNMPVIPSNSIDFGTSVDFGKWFPCWMQLPVIIYSWLTIEIFRAKSFLKHGWKWTRSPAILPRLTYHLSTVATHFLSMVAKSEDKFPQWLFSRGYGCVRGFWVFWAIKGELGAAAAKHAKYHQQLSVTFKKWFCMILLIVFIKSLKENRWLPIYAYPSIRWTHARVYIQLILQMQARPFLRRGLVCSIHLHSK